MNIIISNVSAAPIYEQIREQIKNAIIGGELTEGDLLPSIRGLARDLKVSVITTMRAYTDLEQAGFVVNIQGKGCYVRPKNPELLREQKLCQAQEHLLQAIEAARLCGLSDGELVDMLRILQAKENEDE